MFARVGKQNALPEKIERLTKQPEWYMLFSWTEKEQEKFIDWLTDYLYKSKEARQEIMVFPRRNKKTCREAAQWFVFNYGWTIEPTITTT